MSSCSELCRERAAKQVAQDIFYTTQLIDVKWFEADTKSPMLYCNAQQHKFNNDSNKNSMLAMCLHIFPRTCDQEKQRKCF